MLTIRESLGNVVFCLFGFCSDLAFLPLKYRKARIGSGGKEWMPSAPCLIPRVYHSAESFCVLGDEAFCALYFEGDKIKKPYLDLICSEIFVFL